MTHAIGLNPYIYNMYELRGLCRIRQKHYAQAITDYDAAIRLNPQNQSAWYNRALCRVEDKDYSRAQLDLDTVIVKWKKFAPAYSLKAQVYLAQRILPKPTTGSTAVWKLTPTMLTHGTHVP